jgi:N-acylglucosamine 2-epimerase
MAMNDQRRSELRALFRITLLNDVVPFWLTHSLDQECGGFFNMLDRDGSVYDTDKAMWLQGRGIWLFSTLYNTLELRSEWLDAARLGYDFLVKHGFDTDGRMFFQVTRDGRPLIKRRYLFTEAFAAIACAQYARAAGDDEALARAKAIYRLIVDLVNNPDRLTPKVNPATRRTISHAVPMILLAISQEFRQIDSDPLYDSVAEQAADQILNRFLQPEKRALFETLNEDGSLMLDTVQGRVINPGHAIESGWFLMHEGRHRQDDTCIRHALDIIRWSLDIGWDNLHGGLLYFVDYEGKPPTQLEWDQKLWWPHTEAIYALLLAYHLTGETWCAEWYERVHEWAFKHFPDPDYGEWYGYLHRDGSVLTPAKGSVWKGPFHLPRALLLCYRLLESEKPSHGAPVSIR